MCTRGVTDRFDSITVPDYLEDRFRDKSHILRWISVVIIFSMVTAYTAAQLTASGKAFGSFLGTSYTTGVLIGAAVILYYTTVGGFKAVAYSDLLQGVLMVLCLVTLPFVAIPAAGGRRGDGCREGGGGAGVRAALREPPQRSRRGGIGHGDLTIGRES